MTFFAANFIRWTAAWMKHQVSPDKDQLPIEKMALNVRSSRARRSNRTDRSAAFNVMRCFATRYGYLFAA